MAIVGQGAECDATENSTQDDARAMSAAGAGWAISRRQFLVGAGLTLATTSALSPLLKTAAASSSITALPDGFATGISDSFEELARHGGELALNSFDSLVAANAASIRFPIAWDRVEVEEGRFDWSYYETLHQALVFHGLKAHPVIIGCPERFGAAERKRSANGVYYPTGSRALNAYGAFAVETLKHFNRFGNQISAIEVWSEPNNPRGAHIPDPADFSRLLSTVALYVDCANADGAFGDASSSGMVVLSGGLYATPSDRTWERYLAGFQEQAFPYEVGLHSPASTAKGAATPNEYAQRSAEEIGAAVDRAAAQSGREIWVTATGATAQPPWGDDGQALALGSIASTLATRSQCRAMVVTGVRSGKAPKATPIETPVPMSRLLRSDGTATPALATLQTAWATP